MIRRPLIGVSTSELRRKQTYQPTHHGEPAEHEMALGLNYLSAIEAAGGLPVVLPPLPEAAVSPLLERLSGICLSGGPDLDPAAYGARRDPSLGPTEPQLDAVELTLARRADACEMPILAICRGAQALNITRGGTLHQHLPDVVGGAILHRQNEAGARATHWVKVAPGSLLGAVLGRTRTKVNSFHHQAVDALGRRLRATAWAPDGTVEGIEAEDRDFVVGVQWHIECLAHRAEHAGLFGALVAAARRFERTERPRLRRAA
jgi:putative glutamine amidotransferase